MANPIRFSQVVDNDINEEPAPPNHRLGPWSYGGALYTLQTNTFDDPMKAYVYRSADNGYTWTDQDTAHAPSLRGGNWSSLDSVQVGSKIFVLYTTPTTTGLTIQPFDMVTNLWGAPYSSGLYLDPNFSNIFCYWNAAHTVLVWSYDPLRGHNFIEARADGSFLVMFHYTKTETPTVPVFGGDPFYYTGLKAVVLSPAGVWGTPFITGRSGANYNMLCGTVKGGSNRVHTFFLDEAMTLYHQTIDAANGLHTVQTVASVYIRNPDFTGGTRGYCQVEAVGTPVYNPAWNAIFIPFKNANKNLCVAAATDADDPTWNIEIVDISTQVDWAFDRLYHPMPRCRMACTVVDYDTVVVWVDADRQTCWWSQRMAYDHWSAPMCWYNSGPLPDAAHPPDATYGNPTVYLVASFSMTPQADRIVRVLFMEGFVYTQWDWRYFEFYVTPQVPSTTDVQIVDWDGGSYPGHFMGPFYLEGKLFVVLVDDDYVHIYSSSDKGLTWAESDAANKPQHKNQLAHPAGAPAEGLNLYHQAAPATVPGGSIIYIAFAENDRSLSLGRFDMASSLWLSKVTGGPLVVNGYEDGTGNYPTWTLEATSTGKLALAYSATQSAKACVYMAFYTGAWGTPFRISGDLLNHKRLDSILPGQNGEIHVFWRQQGTEASFPEGTTSICYTVITAAGAVTGELDIGSTGNAFDDIWSGRGIAYGGKVLSAYAAISNRFSTLEGVSVDGPITWTDTITSETIGIWWSGVTGPGRGRHVWGMVRNEFNRTTHAFTRNHSGTSETNTAMIWGQRIDGKAWRWSNAGEGPYLYHRLGQVSPAPVPGGIGVVYTDSGGVSTVPTPTSWKRLYTRFIRYEWIGVVDGGTPSVRAVGTARNYGYAG